MDKQLLNHIRECWAKCDEKIYNYIADWLNKIYRKELPSYPLIMSGINQRDPIIDLIIKVCSDNGLAVLKTDVSKLPDEYSDKNLVVVTGPNKSDLNKITNPRNNVMFLFAQ